MNYRLADLINIGKLQKVLHSLYLATGIPSGVAEIDGTMLTTAGWRDICSKFHRIHQYTSSRCLDSDRYSTEILQPEQKYVSYQCANGLMEVAIPIIVEGQQVGIIFQGQFFSVEPDLQYFAQQAEKFGFDQETYLQAVKAVPVISETEIKPIVDFLYQFGEMVAEMGLARLKQLEMKNRLELSEERLRFAIEGSNDGIWDWDLKTGIFRFNRRWGEMLGYSWEMGEGSLALWSQFIHPLDLSKVVKSMQEHLQGLTPFYQTQYRMQCSSGEWKWFLGRGKVVEWDDQGQPLRVTGTNTDISERKKAEETLQEQLEFSQVLIDTIPVPVFYKDTEGRYLGCNGAFEKAVGLTKAQIIGKRVHDILPAEMATVYGEMDAALFRQPGVQIYEGPLIYPDNTKHEVIFNKATFNKKGGNIGGLIGIIMDVTEQKNKEAQIKYLSFYDKLTGLYNRAFFENELQRLDQPAYLPISIILGDVNGLKLTNDAFGHQAGDRLLQKIAEILKQSVRQQDVVARWAGDEFAVILPKADQQAVSLVCARIMDVCKKADKAPIQPSIAIGSSTKTRINQNIRKCLQEAEDRMYRHKLLEGRSARSGIIASLEKTLFESNFETKEHAERMVNLSIKLGHQLGLSDNQLDELNLLARLHDIGKIAVPDSVLMKPGKLSPREWETMKKHSEIGYRIAESSKDLAHIAEYILSHHERWDGKGYPQGLEGEEIPILSRVIAVVDAYDVMTHVRPYKEALSPKEARAELKKCSGAQFDPQVVEAFLSSFSE